MILNKLVYDVREALNAYTDDSEIDDRYIIYLYGIKRAKYLRQELNNLNRSIDNSIQQELCLELEEVPVHSCGIDLECGTILRTKQILPKTLELHTKSAIVSIKPTNRLSIPFNVINKSRLAYMDGATFPNSLYAYLDTDNHIYVVSKDNDFKLLECLTVTGVFEDPLALSDYSSCCGCDTPKPCYDEMESDYPLQPHFIDLIKNEIVNDLIRKFQIPEDKVNNSTD